MIMMFNERKIYRVLAVDDEEYLLQLYNEILSSNNEGAGNCFYNETSSPAKDFLSTSFNVTLCNQGDKAIEEVKNSLVENNPFSVAFIDVRMPPGPNGVWTAEKIRSLDPFIEIVIVTGYSDIDPEYIAQCIQPPHRLLYMQKPFHAHEIWQIATALSSKWSLEKFLMKMHEEMEVQIRERNIEFAKITHSLNKTSEFAGKIALTDPITGLHNKAYFNRTIHDWVDYAKKNKMPLSLLIFDIENFKNFSEENGRQKGDALLHDIGKIVKCSLRRKSDTPFSDINSIYKLGVYGFAVILPCTDKAGAVALSERLKEGIETHTGFSITIGISELNNINNDEGTLIEDANHNLEKSTQKAM